MGACLKCSSGVAPWKSGSARRRSYQSPEPTSAITIHQNRQRGLDPGGVQDTLEPIAHARQGAPHAPQAHAIVRWQSGIQQEEEQNGKGEVGEKQRPATMFAGADCRSPAFVEMLAKSAEPMRGDILRALGFFHDPRTYQTLFDNLHSAQVTDRMNSILGLKNLGGKEVIPALLAALNDPEAQVRQVANFALEGLTGHKVAVSADPSREESERVASNWHAWWREHAGSFSPPRPAACHDW